MDINITGSSKSGKTSIKKVIFEKKYPYETVYNESTDKPENLQVDSLGYFYLNLTEFPSSFSSKDANEYEKYLTRAQTFIFVIDTQTPLNPQYDYLKNVIPELFKYKSSISLCIFLHKIDNANSCQTDYYKQRDEISSTVEQICKEANLNDLKVSYFATSIYNSSLFEAFSKIFQNIPQNRNLSALIDHLANTCGFERAFLFDVFNKIYLASDSSPNGAQSYEICSDFIDLVLDVNGIYCDQKEMGESDSCFDDNSICSIKINSEINNDSKNILFLKFIHKNLALIAIVNEENYERNNLLEHNINLFKQAVKNILKK
jgi:Ras-related GTP-binding protein C/D